MSIPVIAASFRSSDLNADPLEGLFIQRRTHDAIEVRGGTSTRLGLSGRITRPQRKHVISWVYEGCIQADPEAADPQADIRTKITAAEALFDPTQHGTFSETLEDGSVRTIDARARNYDIDNWEIPEYAHVSVEFESWDEADWDVTPAGS